MRRSVNRKTTSLGCHVGNRRFDSINEISSVHRNLFFQRQRSTFFHLQWGIQAFPDGETGEGRDANPLVWGENLLFSKIFSENYMKMKEIEPE